MIARVRLALPFLITIPLEETLDAIEYDEAGYHITIFPPYQAELSQTEFQLLSPVSMRETVNKLVPVASPRPMPSMQIDGKPVFQANALQIDFQKDAFDRRIAIIHQEHDPAQAFVLNVANNFLAKFRSVAQGMNIKPLDKTIWKLAYLTDTGEELPQHPDLFRANFGYSGHMEWTLLNQEMMTKIKALPQEYEMQTWETLILDAQALLPDVRASVVLAYSAVETMIAVALDYFVITTSNSPDLWKWINDRGFFLKNPAVEEQYTVLLKILIGKSLKEEASLWKAFTDLRKTRNEIAHTGRAVLNKTAVDSQMAGQLINGANEIINWLENLLPEQMRRPKYEAHTQMSFIKLLTD